MLTEFPAFDDARRESAYKRIIAIENAASLIKDSILHGSYQEVCRTIVEESNTINNRLSELIDIVDTFQ